MRSAFTLIELALVLVIVSLMTGFGLQAFESTSGVNCVSSTQEQLKTIDRSLQNYAAAHSRYPKPAAVNLGSNNPQFGYEGTDGSSTPPTDPAFITIVPAGVTNASGTLIGSLPHVALGLPASYASDCWGSKFTYAVANSQTGSDPNVGFRSAALGNIELRTGNLSSSQQLSPHISYVVVSHGEDKYGATPMSAGNPAARNCNGSTAGKIDRENCNTDAVFYSAMVNTGDGNNYFDDMMVYSSKIQSTEDCPDQNVNWSPSCSGMTGVVLHGTTAVVGSTAPNYWVGNTTVSCNDGVLTQTGVPTCEQQTPCGATTLTWNNSGAAGSPCSAAVTGRNHNQSHSNVPNATGGYTGSVTAQCVNGSFTNYSGVSCTPNPCSGSQSWGPGNGCTGSVSNLASGSTQSVANTNTAQFSGSADFLCTTGTLSISGTPSCVSVTNPCSAGSVSWGSGCSANAAAMVHAAPAQSVSNSAGGYSGSANVTCNNGTLSAAGTCFANCSARSETWSSCTGNTPAITHGSASSVSNTASGYTGAVTMSCTNGSLSQSGASCIADPPLPAGQMYCWGRNSISRFGNGETSITNYSLPQLAATFPSGVSSWKAVSTGTYHGCAIGNNNQAYCWGYGDAGAIGNNLLTTSAVPTIVTRPSGVASWTKIAAGGNHNCAIGNNSQLYCWGSGSFHVQGNGSTNNVRVPSLVANPSGVSSWVNVAGGISSTCGIADTGQLYCWGDNSYGQIGNNSTSTATAPTLVVNPSGVSSWSAVTIGNYNACGIGNNGRAYCWGMGAMIGEGTPPTQRNVPTLVTNPSGVSSWRQVDSGTYNNCGIGNNGRAYCWGYNAYGALGNGTTNAEYLPVIVTNPSGVTTWTSVKTADQHSCGLANNGLVYCWGQNDTGKIGDGTTTQRLTPRVVSLPGGVTQWGGVFLRNEYSCATAIGGGCIADGGSSAGVAFNCCSGDPDGNGTCGNQPGTCGSANGTTLNASAPSSGLCSVGVASAVTGSGPYNWTCGGTPCQAYRRCDAGQYFTWMTNCSGTTTYNNAHGFYGALTSTAPSHTGTLYLTCNNGTYTLGSSTCGPAPVCGVAHGSSYASTPPVGDLCSVGTAAFLGGSGPYTWQCSGSGGGMPVNCSANRSCTALNPMAWMSNCQANLAGNVHGYLTPLVNTAPGYSGTVSMRCDQGTWIPTSPSCSAVAGCAAGWSKVYHFSDEASYDCRSYDNTIGLCTSGEGGTSASSRGNPNTCIMPGSCVDARQCGCVGNGAAVPNHGYGPQPQLCCNGDSDGNGVCGTQASCSPCATFAGTEGDLYGSGGNRGCWNYTKADCSTEYDLAPCDGTISSPPPGWSNCSGAPSCTPAANGQPPANPCGCQNPDTDGNGLCGTQAVTCTDECGVTRNDGQIWCPPTGYGGVGDGSRCSSGTITQEYNPSCNNPQPCAGAGEPPGGNVGGCSGALTCQGGVWGNHNYCGGCDFSQCASGTGHAEWSQNTGGCGSQDCSRGDTMDMFDCEEVMQCICD